LKAFNQGDLCVATTISSALLKVDVVVIVVVAEVVVVITVVVGTVVVTTDVVGTVVDTVEVTTEVCVTTGGFMAMYAAAPIAINATAPRPM
jgi:hypothetical protein